MHHHSPVLPAHTTPPHTPPHPKPHPKPTTQPRARAQHLGRRWRTNSKSPANKELNAAPGKLLGDSAALPVGNQHFTSKHKRRYLHPRATSPPRTIGGARASPAPLAPSRGMSSLWQTGDTSRCAPRGPARGTAASSLAGAPAGSPHGGVSSGRAAQACSAWRRLPRGARLQAPDLQGRAGSSHRRLGLSGRRRDGGSLTERAPEGPRGPGPPRHRQCGAAAGGQPRA